MFSRLALQLPKAVKDWYYSGVMKQIAADVATRFPICHVCTAALTDHLSCTWANPARCSPELGLPWPLRTGHLGPEAALARSW